MYYLFIINKHLLGFIMSALTLSYIPLIGPFFSVVQQASLTTKISEGDLCVAGINFYQIHKNSQSVRKLEKTGCKAGLQIA
jgi:hypothetical protein